jgi:hypothetical protein
LAKELPLKTNPKKNSKNAIQQHTNEGTMPKGVAKKGSIT